tara:strand:+ start:1240 stop:1410 length:171 start_codon:yes stop_codon:yes gene_type:complete
MAKSQKNIGGSVLADLIIPAVFVYANNNVKKSKKSKTIKKGKRKSIKNKTRFRKRK